MTHNQLPTGTVTFMFTDIKDSTVLLRNAGDDGYRQLLERHNQLIREALQAHDGLEVATEGDSFFAVFEAPDAALAAAVGIQNGLSTESWPGGVEVTVRIGIHSGNGVLGASNYVGVDVHRAQRVAAAAHGGQVLVSSSTAGLVGGRLPSGAELRELGRHRLPGFDRPEVLFQIIAPGLDANFPPPRGSIAATRLPELLSEFIGREEELSTIESLVGRHRLITLTGPGGTGKTRLSIELARRVEARFNNGAFFVPLATINDAELIPSKILEVLELGTAAGIEPLTHLQRYLADRSVLLILDNFEHLLDGAPAVAALLDVASGLIVVATSRTPLRIAGEREFPVPALGVPDDAHLTDPLEAPSVKLFATRAAAVRPGFELSTANIETVISITRSLDGLPLAIELAASRMRSLTPEVILERLSNRLLSSSSTNLPQRQQSIVNAIGWSYDLLDDPTRRLFEELSVFAGTFSLEHAEAVCRTDSEEGDVLDGLTRLVENSLILPIESSGVPRFRMLTVIREYGFAALVARGIEVEIQERHAAAFLELAEQADGEILTSRQGYWLDRLSTDLDNLRVAIDHAIRHNHVTIAHRFAGCLWRFWQIRGHIVEGRKRTQEAVDLGEGKDRRARAKALTGLAGLRYWQGDWQGTLQPYQEALELFRAIGDQDDVAEALYNMSFPLMYSGDIDGAEKLLEKSLALSERIGRRIGVGRAYWGLGEIAVFRGQWNEAVAWNMRAAEEFLALDAPFDLAWAWFVAAHAHAKDGMSDEAEAYLQRCLEVFVDATDLSALTLVFEALALVSLRRGDRARAARLIGAAHRLKSDTGVSLTEVEVNLHAEIVEFVSEMSDADEAAYQEGYDHTVDEAVAHAREAGHQV